MMNLPSPRQIPKAVLMLALLGLLVLIATRVLSSSASAAANAVK